MSNEQVANGGIKDIEANLNFDMVGSPNFVRFVYDGDASSFPPPPGGAPAGSAQIEQIFLRYFQSKRLMTDPTAFDGRSDYGAFIANGVPAGGLFTGAEGIKTERQESIYGGFAGTRLRPLLPPGVRHVLQSEPHGAGPDVRRRGPHDVDARALADPDRRGAVDQGQAAQA